ncbi:MAG: hypothetical protein CVV41_22360 [Candidatus Riflebacteria bacterium HGW-Riflebacteria-1]|nr:MAG: hypothetical protein CVV41_22360 [Candidatus Riflebacteria bacterium HGW-Riflebacteria-1]
MQPIFTIHAGEYLVGSHIEQNLRDDSGNKFQVWIPSKDKGIDLLLTNHDNSKTASLQVKFSKDFLVTHGRPEYQEKLVSCGWWTLNPKKIEESIADFWVFVLHTFNQRNMQFVVISPNELKRRLNLIHSDIKSLQTYLWITKDHECWETRGLKKEDTDLILQKSYSGPDKENRDFSDFLNNWNAVTKKLT